MSKIPFDSSNPDIEAVRRIMIARLRGDSSFRQLPREDRVRKPTRRTTMNRPQWAFGHTFVLASSGVLLENQLMLVAGCLR